MKSDSRIQIILASVLIIISIAGCKDYKPEMEQAQYQRDSVILMTEAKDSSINAFLEALGEIEGNLDQITQSQQAISEDAKDKVEFNKDIRERINQNIVVINELLTKNNELIESLNKKLKNSKFNISALNKKIASLTEQVNMKNEELAVLNSEITSLHSIVDSLNVSIDTLKFQSSSKDLVIEEKINELNTAYWVMGTYKELNSQFVIDKQGGFLGLGKEAVVKKNFNSDAFNKIDITTKSKFEINNKSVKIITTHPTDSYKLEKDEKGKVLYLEITNPASFWKASKYLVIVTG